VRKIKLAIIRMVLGCTQWIIETFYTLEEIDMLKKEYAEKENRHR